MRTGTMTPSEFVSGEGVARIRREKSVEHLKKRAEDTRANFYKRIGDLAYLRMALLIPWWHQKFPTRRLNVIFGMGASAISVDGRHVWITPGDRAEVDPKPGKTRSVTVPDSCFDLLEVALKDVDDITNGFRDGAPRDFTVEPIQTRGKQ